MNQPFFRNLCAADIFDALHCRKIGISRGTPLQQQRIIMPFDPSI